MDESLATDVRAMVDALATLQSCLICSHEAPEGDCLGAALALGLALEARGVVVRLYNPDVIPSQYRFMAGIERMERQVPEGPFDAVVVVDCGDLARVGREAHRLPALGPIFNIDHHRSNTRFGALNLVAPTLSSSGELVYELLERLGCPVTVAIGEALYAAIMTDTGSFRYSSTTGRTLQIAGLLVEAGVEPNRVGRGLFDQAPVARLRLLSRVLETLEVAAHGGWARLVLSQAMLTETGAVESDAEGFVNYARSIAGVEVAMLFREREPGLWAVSFRGQGAIDVSALAAQLGGGGHFNAAACRVTGSREAVAQQVLDLVERCFSGADNGA